MHVVQRRTKYEKILFPKGLIVTKNPYSGLHILPCTGLRRCLMFCRIKNKLKQKYCSEKHTTQIIIVKYNKQFHSS